MRSCNGHSEAPRMLTKNDSATHLASLFLRHLGCTCASQPQLVELVLQQRQRMSSGHTPRFLSPYATVRWLWAVRYPNRDGSALNAMKDAVVRWYSLCHNFMPLLRLWSGRHCARGLIQSLIIASGRCRFEVAYKILVICLLQCWTFTQPSLQS
jgi:hypothetical protein